MRSLPTLQQQGSKRLSSAVNISTPLSASGGLAARGGSILGSETPNAGRGPALKPVKSPATGTPSTRVTAPQTPMSHTRSTPSKLTIARVPSLSDEEISIIEKLQTEQTQTLEAYVDTVKLLEAKLATLLPK
jgi:hypothetical protein